MTEAATSAAPLIPLKVLFGNPQRTQPRLSPDGQRLAYIAPLDGVLNVWVGPVRSDAGGGAFEPVTRDTDRGIRMYLDRKSTRLNSSHANISYAVFCLKKRRGGARRSARHGPGPASP